MTQSVAMRHARRAIALAVAAAFACTSVSATTITVTTGGDAGDASTCTLRQAINSANTDASSSTCVAGSGADVIEFDPSLVGSVITLSAGELSLTSDITLTGSGQVIDAQYGSRVMNTGSLYHISSSYRISVSNLTLRHGDAGTYLGGGIYVVGGHVSLANMTIANNAAGGGGGIQVRDADFSLTQSTVSGNRVVTLSGGNIGGGIGSSSNSSFTLDHVQITGNYASGGSGAGVAGAIFEYGSSVDIRYSTISGNAVSNQGSGVLIGGIYAQKSPRLSITQTLIAGNTATVDSASIHSYATGGLYLQFCAQASLRNTTVTANQAHGYQASNVDYAAVGGLRLLVSGAGSTALISNATITQNTAYALSAFGGVVVSGTDGSIDMRNSIVSGNTGFTPPTGTAVPDFYALYGSTVLLRSNLLGTALQGTWAGNGNLFADHPHVQALANNGGPTRTMALQPGSPAVDAGDNTLVPVQDTTDQRGTPFARVTGAAVDMGAFEWVPDEREALIALYLATGGNGWADNSNWCNGACPSSGTPTFNALGTECTWFGVICDGTPSHVVRVDLHANQLSGGPLPDLTALTELAELELYDNQISGSLPDLHAAAHLATYALFANRFSGPIPADLATWPALVIFQVNQNQLAGSIPSLTGLGQLQDFEVANNQLRGSVPSLAGLTQLQIVDISSNLLSGALPNLSGLSQLQVFYASDNQLSGALPSLTGLANLNILDVNTNYLTGSVPSLAGLNKLSFAVFAGNQLSGGFPDLSGTPSLGHLDLSSNQLSGSLPDLSAEIHLDRLYLQYNRFTGALPTPPPQLAPHQAYLCPNLLSLAPGPNDNAWNAATGQTPWWGPPGGGCDAIMAGGFESLINASFENGLTGWHIGSGSCIWETASAGVVSAGFGQWAAPTPVDGTYALLEDDQTYGECTLYQDVTVPSGAHSASLSAAVAYNIAGPNSDGCGISLAVTTPGGSLVTTYIALSGPASTPLQQYAPIGFGVQPGEVLRIAVTTTNVCPDYPAGIVLDNVNLNMM